MFEICADVLLVYAFSLATGLGLATLVTPSFFKRPLYYLHIAPSLGLLQLTIIAGFCISASRQIGQAIPVCVGLAIIASLLAVFTSFPDDISPRYVSLQERWSKLRERWTNIDRPYLQQYGIFHTVFVLALAITILAPVFHAGLATTPYRIGIDQVGYGESGQYLLEGGTYNQSKATLLHELGTNDLVKAKVQNSKLLSFQHYIDSEFILKAMRWGFPGVIAVSALLTHSYHVYQVEFIILVLSMLFLASLLFDVFVSTFGFSRPLAYAFTAATVLNCNLLNVYYEGQLAQIFVAPYFTMLLLCYARIRSMPAFASRETLHQPWFSKAIILFALLLAGLFSAYNESILLITGFIYATLLFDFLFKQRTSRTAMVFLTLGFAVGFAFAAPISSKWLAYTIANLHGLGKSGFWQPHWGSYAEILGFMDMYHPTGYTLLARSPSNLVLCIVLSVLLAAISIWYFVRDKDVDRSFWLTAPCLTIAAFMKLFYLDGMLNYSYMKIYTVLSPLICAAAFAAIIFCVRLLPKRFYAVSYAIAAVVIITSLGYVTNYVKESKFVSHDMLSLYQQHQPRAFSTSVLFTDGGQLDKSMIAPIIAMNWINEDETPKFIAPYLSTPVDVLFGNDDLICRECFLKHFKGHAVALNSSYVVYHTGLPLKDFCVPEAAQYQVDLLGTADTRESWRSLSDQQCRYKFAQTLPYARIY